MIHKRLSFAVLCAVLVYGCAGMQAPPAPRTLAEGIAQAHVGIQEATSSTEHLLDIDAITLDQAQYVHDRLAVGTQALEKARGFLAVGDPTQAEAQLDIVEAILIEVKGGAH